MKSMQSFENELSKDLSAWLRHDFVMLEQEYARHSSCESASLLVKIETSFEMWPSGRSLTEAKAGDFYTSSRREMGLEGAGISVLPHATPCKLGNQAVPVTPHGWEHCQTGGQHQEKDASPSCCRSVRQEAKC